MSECGENYAKKGPMVISDVSIDEMMMMMVMVMDC